MKITKETIVKVKRFKTKDGYGCGVFTAENGDLILDETIGLDVEYYGGTAKGEAEAFGALRAKFGWK